MNNDPRFRLGDDGELVPIGKGQPQVNHVTNTTEKPKPKNVHSQASPSPSAGKTAEQAKVALVALILIIMAVLLVHHSNQTYVYPPCRTTYLGSNERFVNVVTSDGERALGVINDNTGVVCRYDFFD